MASNGQDYDLNRPIGPTSGMRQGLTSYGDAHFSLFLRKVFIKAMGYSEDALSRPIVGVVNTYSSFNPCHANVPQLIEAVKRGVNLAGGLAIDFPTISLHESFAAPTSMFLRNLMSMDTEEMVRAQPVDCVVLIGGMFDFLYPFSPLNLKGEVSVHGDDGTEDYFVVIYCVKSLYKQDGTDKHRLRQNHARAAHGWYISQQADLTSRYGADDAGKSPGNTHRGLYRLSKQLGQLQGRCHGY